MDEQHDERPTAAAAPDSPTAAAAPDAPAAAAAPDGHADTGEHPEVTAALAAEPLEAMPPQVLSGLLATVAGEVRRRAEGEATRERAAAIAASLERSNVGSFGVNVPRRPTVPHVSTGPGITAGPSDCG
ncbi:hypothetical protein GC722_00730 [Auraticoccus sp. F435]|uniref:Uncharacterized protein n=1 Tax=Auraticoccus cholistanensis TaxID=2656650 RepID=A0A6A9UNX0_9ACTN|nr:hypothetical protein [Auraticoccus cholistanensis]MVA74566.1 hypothetical protein [Auraticoccus cholistanensis]